MRCAILCRKSNPQEATGDEKSVALQERECRALIERNGWELADGPRNRTGTSRPQPGRGQGCIGIGTADGRARRGVVLGLSMPSRQTFPAGCASAASGAATRLTARVPRNARRSITL
jgi:hypothetical protein